MTKRLNINKNWYGNKAVKPKTFIVTMTRFPNGQTQTERVDVVNEKNQHASTLQKVDARDFTADLNRAKITAR